VALAAPIAAAGVALATPGVRSSPRKKAMRKGAEEMRRLKTSRRFAGLIAVLVLATGITAASAQPESRTGHGKRAGLELTYTKWFAQSFPRMVGVSEETSTANSAGLS
jgi:hypothetical protein